MKAAERRRANPAELVAMAADPLMIEAVARIDVIATHTEQKIVRRLTPSALPGTTTWDPRSTPTPPGLVTA